MKFYVLYPLTFVLSVYKVSPWGHMEHVETIFHMLFLFTLLFQIPFNTAQRPIS
jgi:hypothetical protein